MTFSAIKGTSLRTVLSLVFIGLGLTGLSPYPVDHAAGLGNASVRVFSNVYHSSNVTDTSLIPGSQVTFEVNSVAAPPFNGYEFVLYYDASFLRVGSIDVRTGTVFSNPFIALQDFAILGALRLSVVNLGGSFNGGTGTLVHIVFDVVAFGVSPMVLAAGTARPSSADQSETRLVLGLTPIDVSTSDGYFKNVAGISGPSADFTFSPASPLKGGILFFNATESLDSDSVSLPDRGINEYIWDFGDGQGVVSVFPLVTHRFRQPQVGGPDFDGNFSVRLTVTDADDGFEGIRTHLVSIDPTAAPPAPFGIDAGPMMTITDNSFDVRPISVFSIGGFAGIVNLTVSSFPVLPNGLSMTLSQTSLNVSAGASVRSTLTTTTAGDTPPGHYVIVVRGSSGGVVELGLLFAVVLPREPVFGSARFTWTRKISVSNNPLETWKGQVVNPNTGTALRVRLHVTGTIVGVPIFFADSPTITIAGGASGFLNATRLFPSYQAGLTFGFSATVVWSVVSGSFMLSSSVVTGTVMVSK